MGFFSKLKDKLEEANSPENIASSMKSATAMFGSVMDGALLLKIEKQ